jgi:hypothetical protein
MDDETLRQIVQAALDGTKPPELSKQDMGVYIRALFARGIIAVAGYDKVNGLEILAKVSMPSRSAEIDAEIGKILSS